MMKAHYIVLLTSVLSAVYAGDYTLGREADKVCQSYGKMCPYGKICAIQHLHTRPKMSIPVCISKEYIPVKSENCYLPPNSGLCPAKFIRWYYNRHSRECSWFQYTGCGGNANRFNTKVECESYCTNKKSAVRGLTMRRGQMDSGGSIYDRYIINDKPDNGYNDIESEWLGNRQVKNATSHIQEKRANTLVVTITANPLNTGKPASSHDVIKRRPRCTKWNKLQGIPCIRRSRKGRKSRKNRRKNGPAALRRKSNPLPPPIFSHSISEPKDYDRGSRRFLPGGATVHRLFAILHSPNRQSIWHRHNKS